MRLLLALLAAVAMATMPVHATKGISPGPGELFVSVSAASGPLFSAKPSAPSMVVPVAGPYCSACRSVCVQDYKVDCGTSNWCRKQFTQCMRYCWYEYCR